MIFNEFERILMEDCSLYIYTLMCKFCIENLQLKEVFLSPFVKQWLCDRQLHVTDIL